MKSSSNASKLKMVNTSFKRSPRNPSLIIGSASRLRTSSSSSGYLGEASSPASQTSSPAEARANMKYIKAKFENLTEEMRWDRAEYRIKLQAANRLQAEFSRCRTECEIKVRAAIKRAVVKNRDEILDIKNSSEQLEKRVLDLQQTVDALQVDVATLKTAGAGNNVYPTVPLEDRRRQLMIDFFSGESIPWSRLSELV